MLNESFPTIGCSNTDSVKITVNPRPTASYTFANVCLGDSSNFTNNSLSATSYSWSFGDTKTSTQQNPKHLYTNNGNYKVSLKALNTYGCADSSSKTLVISSCVWPGDANGDKTVDMKDFLAIGIAYGTIGHTRPSANILWTGQPSQDWDSSFANGVNYKHADCNGDSIINYNDTIAISTNYGKSHSKSSPLSQGNPSDPQFRIQYSKDTFFAGDTVVANLVIGSSTNPVKGIYGLKFSISANPLLFEVDKAELKMNTSFFGIPNTDILGLKINDLSNSLVNIGLTRINQKNTSGFGNVATLQIPVKTTLPAEYNKFSLGISDNLQITFNEKNVPLYFVSDSILLKRDRTGIQSFNINSLSRLTVFPNPFQSTTTISYDLVKTSDIQISLFDITGKQAELIPNQSQVAGNYELTIDSEKYHLKPGMYMLRIMVNGAWEGKSLIKL